MATQEGTWETVGAWGRIALYALVIVVLIANMANVTQKGTPAQHFKMPTLLSQCVPSYNCGWIAR